jgi:hypothetical protein
MLDHIFQNTYVAIDDPFLVMTKIQMNEEVLGQGIPRQVMLDHFFVGIVAGVENVQVLVDQFSTSKVTTPQIHNGFKIVVKD